MGRSRGLTFLIWDVGGQEKVRPLWKSYTRATDAVIYVVDSTDTERLEEAKLELHRIMRSVDNVGVPLLVIANKQVSIFFKSYNYSLVTDIFFELQPIMIFSPVENFRNHLLRIVLVQ